MLKQIPVSAALAGLALTGALCACGSATPNGAAAGVGAGASVSPSATSTSAGPPSPVTSSLPTTTTSPGRASSPPVMGDPIIFAVRLGPGGFQPRTLRISPGQHFVVTVDSSVKASGPGISGTCSSASTEVDDGLLSVTCSSGTFSYTAQRAGAAELTATVRPNCQAGSMCPQWIAEATLKITIL